MAYSIAKAVQSSVKGYNRPGGRAKGSFRPSTTKNRGNVTSLRVKGGTTGGSKGTINTVPTGYSS